MRFTTAGVRPQCAVRSRDDDLTESGADDGTERRAELMQLIDRLPPDQRSVVTRRFLDDRTIAEIARELNRSEGAIKQLQFRALQTMRSHTRTYHEY